MTIENELQKLVDEFERRWEMYRKMCMEDRDGDPRMRGADAGQARAYGNASEEVKAVLALLKAGKLQEDV